MSTQDQIDRIKQNVANTYAVLSALGADMPEEQTSDNLATTAGSAKAVLYSAQSLTEAQKAQARENIGIVSTDGDTVIPPLKIYAIKGDISYTQEIIDGGATKTYTAAEIHGLISQRIVTVETYTDINTSKGRGLHQYFETTFATDGSVNQVVFRGVYVNDLYKLVPSYVTINNLGNVFVSDAEWSADSVETDQSLSKLGSPADAKKVGDKLTELSEQIANSGGGTSINVTAEVGQTIVVKEVDADGKPTAWEAAEYQPRTHWAETGIGDILPETAPTMDSESGVGIITSLLEIKAGSTYTVTWNSVNYECVGKPFSENETEIGAALGNFDAMMGTGDTGEPFAIVAVYPEYYDGNLGGYIVPFDGTAEPVVKITGEVELVHTLEKKYLPELRGQKKIILNVDEGTASANSSDFYDADIAELTGAITIIDNSEEFVVTGIRKTADEVDGIKSSNFIVFYNVGLTLKTLNWIYNKTEDAVNSNGYGLILHAPGSDGSVGTRIPMSNNGHPNWRGLRDYAPDRVVLRATDEETNDVKYYALTVDYSTGALNVAGIPIGTETANLWS